jgi:hypothetical protein
MTLILVRVSIYLLDINKVCRKIIIINDVNLFKYLTLIEKIA